MNSDTGTYVIMIYDEVSENNIRFVKFKLPDDQLNNVFNARSYYAKMTETSEQYIIDCVSWEWFKNHNDISNLPIDEHKFYTGRPISHVSEVFRILDAWNEEKGLGLETHKEILEDILNTLKVKEEILNQIEKEALHVGTYKDIMIFVLEGTKR